MQNEEQQVAKSFVDGATELSIERDSADQDARENESGPQDERLVRQDETAAEIEEAEEADENASVEEAALQNDRPA
jgi:hypothetical protein